MTQQIQTERIDAVRLLAAATAHFPPGMVARQRLVGRGAVEVGSEGAEVRLSDGRVALDFGSYAVPLFGHRPPLVVRAVHEALDTMPTSTRLLANPYAVRLGESLTRLVAPGRLDRVWFGLNGSDVVEAALKLAIARTGRPAVLAVEGAFHGKTMAALAATYDPARRQPLAGFLGDVRHLPPRADAVAEAAQLTPAPAPPAAPDDDQLVVPGEDLAPP
ncbi:aminotransferase class III-fold pyridoxal phosphate-dependent enzyme, partial [Actinoplanes philippinensis]|uniref:aminotransferase class III-fold pyridoxal phosphate-dependent enzyme n=1 Tax=Actinoplanes philippinensis TaxID=35752 RepID=UPI0033E204BB